MAIFDSVLWTFLEPAIGILAACLPTMRLVLLYLTSAPIFRKITSYFAGSKSPGSSKSDREEYGLVANKTIGGGTMPNSARKSKRTTGGSMQELKRKLAAEEQTPSVSSDGGAVGLYDELEAGLPASCSVDHSGFDPYEVCPECAERYQVQNHS